ncbi:hypothetical protein ACFQDN_19550 [Pseudomonas asuensis]
MNSIPARLTFSSALLLLAYYTLSHTRLGTLLIPIRDAQTADNQVVLAVALATFVLVVMQIAACVPLGFLRIASGPVPWPVCCGFHPGYLLPSVPSCA